MSEDVIPYGMHEPDNSSAHCIDRYETCSICKFKSSETTTLSLKCIYITTHPIGNFIPQTNEHAIPYHQTVRSDLISFELQ